MGRILLILAVLGAVIALGAYWIGPGVVPRARLQLVALGSDSRFADDATLELPEDAPRRPVRYPLIMALSNSGEREAEPTLLTLSVPGWVRLENENGPLEPSADDAEEPLRRYALQLGGEQIEPGALPQVPAGLDRLSIVVELPAMTCSLRWDGVPEFRPNPEWDAETLSHIVVFYSLDDRRTRQTGVLTLRLEPDRVTPPEVRFSTGAVSINRPGTALPATDSLTLVGRVAPTCGAPELRVHLESAVWSTGPTGQGRLIVIYHDGVPRRFLTDADGDGIVEREAWDGDADGLFEASRTASWTVPAFLLPANPVIRAAPAPAPPAPDSTPRPAADSVAPTDSMRADTTSIDTVRSDTMRTDTMRIDTMRIDTVRIDTTHALPQGGEDHAVR